MNRLIVSAVLLICTMVAHAGEAEVKKAWEAALKMQADNVTKSGYLGLYEVFSGGEVFYTDEKVSTILRGELIDPKTRQNITRARLQKLTAIKFSDLPLNLAVKQVRGNGKRVFASFEDPNCGYCKRLAKEMATLDNVTIYTFMIPILSPDSKEKSERIWCSADRVKAWNDWMTQGREPQSSPANCDTTAISKNLELSRKLGVHGTPTLFFANGERAPGAIPIAEIEQRLGPVTN